MLKLNLQYFGHLMRRTDSLDPDAGKDWGQEKGEAEDEMVDSMDMSLSKFRETVRDSEVWHAAVHGITKSRTQLHDWTETNKAVATLRPGDTGQLFVF